MSDPLSITGSAVGVISLGLVVCDQIVQYGRAYKGYREDIQLTAARAEAVCAPLKVLRDIIEMTRINQPDTAIDLSESVMRIEASVTRLREAIKRYGPTNHADGSPDTTRNQARRTIYHFRKDTLRDIGQDLDNMQSTLRTLISAYNLKETIHARQETKEIHLLIQSGIPPQSLLQAWYDAQTGGNSSIKSDKSVSSKNKALAKHDVREIKKGFSSYSRWLGLVITASLNISIDGGGGISIHPALSVRIPVSNSNEIRQLFHEITQMKDHERAILRLQDEFSNQRIHPSCVVPGTYYQASSLIGILLDLELWMTPSEERTKFLLEIIRFLLDSGVRVSQDRTSGDVNIWRNSWDLHNCEREYASIMERVINSGLHIDIPCNGESAASPYLYPFWKDSLGVILSIDDEIVEMPEVAKVVLRRDSQRLRKALCLKQTLPKDLKSSGPSDPSSLLHLAEGWVDGIRILLEFGADACQHFPYLDRPGEEYYQSCAVLLRAGCIFSKEQMAHSYSSHDKGRRMHLFINELKARREKLRILAETFLPSKMVPARSSLLDGPDAGGVYELLISRTRNSTHLIPPKVFFFPNSEDQLMGQSSPEFESIYHDLFQVECAEALYEVGFRATSMLDQNGNTPLGTIASALDRNRNSPIGILARPHYSSKFEELMEIIQWHISKGSKVDQRLPWADESVAHLLIIEAFHSLLSSAKIPPYISVERIREYKRRHIHELEENFNRLENIYAALSPLPSVSGRSSCLCSLGGLTAASLICRETLGSFVIDSSECSVMRYAIIKLLEFESFHGKNPLAFIRALTFNALDLTHTCFDKTHKGCIWHRNANASDESWINSTCDEPSAIEEFENLQAQLEQRFNELGLPLKEFVLKHWYRIVKDNLLTTLTPDEQHKCIEDARKIGVVLEQWEPSVPEWMTILFAAKVEEVDDEED